MISIRQIKSPGLKIRHPVSGVGLVVGDLRMEAVLDVLVLQWGETDFGGWNLPHSHTRAVKEHKGCSMVVC